MKHLPDAPPRLYLVPAGAARRFEENWRLHAACQAVDPELFFPVSSAGKCVEQEAEAKAVCGSCLVRRQCLTFALQTRQAYGIWGGLTEEERKRKTPRREVAGDALDSPASA